MYGGTSQYLTPLSLILELKVFTSNIENNSHIFVLNSFQNLKDTFYTVMKDENRKIFIKKTANFV